VSTYYTAPALHVALARMPPTLRPPTITSFGHLRLDSTPSAASASATARPAARGRTRERAPGGARGSSTHSYRSPGADDQRLPCRPRPAVCASASTTVH